MVFLSQKVRYNANLRYDSEVKHWLANFKSLPDISKFADKIEYEIDNWGENYRSSKILLNVIKRINKCAAKPVKEKDERAVTSMLSHSSSLSLVRES